MTGDNKKIFLVNLSLGDIIGESKLPLIHLGLLSNGILLGVLRLVVILRSVVRRLGVVLGLQLEQQGTSYLLLIPLITLQLVLHYLELLEVLVLLERI